MDTGTGKKQFWFLIAAVAIFAMFLLSAWRINAFNSIRHHESFRGEELFAAEEAKSRDVSVTAVPRSSTWTKAFDLRNEGIAEHNVRAYTYDFSVLNHTNNEVADFSYKLIFDREVFLLSAWNGALEIHQNVPGGEAVATIPDLREFVAGDYPLRMVTFDGETLIYMKPGEYLVYHPNPSQAAREMPLEPYGGTTPGIILYVAMDESLEGAATLELEYTLRRTMTGDPLFWISLFCFIAWLIALLVFAITAVEIRKYQKRHERDKEIINEFIETFTGFVDAKDSYTNGHSKRVAVYTRRIAQEMGYEGDELDRIYYIALLHDCGKIGVPDNILGKPSRLTNEEFEIMKSHTVCGGDILKHFRSLKDAGEGALYHHERYDGKGYPARLSGSEIPVIARIICVADTFDAMNTNRVYRRKLPKERIMNEFEMNKGLQFDPEIADILLRLLREGKLPVEDME